MAGPGPDYIVTNPAANTWYIATVGQGIVPASSSNNTYECRSFNSGGTQTVYGSLAAGAHDVTTNSDSRSSLLSGFGTQWSTTLGNNGTDTVVPQGEISVTLSGGNYIAIRVFSYTGRPAISVLIYRSGVWQYLTAIKIYRSGAWTSLGGKVNIYRSGSWKVIG